MSEVRAGTSGRSYDPWEPVLYPPGLPGRDRLARYVEAFGTVELNASFYRWPRPASFASWRRLPGGPSRVRARAANRFNRRDLRSATVAVPERER